MFTTKKELFEKLGKAKFFDGTKTLIITHSDLDGVGAAILLDLLPGDVTVIHCQNDVMSDVIFENIKKGINQYDNIFITDISCKEDAAQKIDDVIHHDNPHNCKVILIDHHASAEYLSKYDWAVVYSDAVSDSFRNFYGYRKSSATALLYDYLEYINAGEPFKLDDGVYLEEKIIMRRHVVQIFVRMVSEYDTRNYPRCLARDISLIDLKEDSFKLNSLCRICGLKEFRRMMSNRLINGNIWQSFDNQLIKLDHERTMEKLEALRKDIHVNMVNMNGKQYRLVYCFNSTVVPNLLEYMKEKFPEGDIYAVMTDRAITLRHSSHCDVDLSEIAKRLGGGGHPDAAGLPIPEYERTALMMKYLQAEIIDD